MRPDRVIGVVGHLQHRSVTDYGREQMFLSSRLQPRNPLAYVVRMTQDDPGLAERVRAVIKEMDPALPMYDVRKLKDYAAVARSPQEFTAALAGVFGAVALALCCVGVYGVVAYAVAQRRREFGIRLALGAHPGAITALVVRDGLKLTIAGAALGIVGAAAGARLLRGSLFGVSAGDPVAFGTALMLLAAAALVAAWLPARRASRSSPVAVLRQE